MRYLIITTYESLWDAEVGILDNGNILMLSPKGVETNG